MGTQAGEEKMTTCISGTSNLSKYSVPLAGWCTPSWLVGLCCLLQINLKESMDTPMGTQAGEERMIICIVGITSLFETAVAQCHSNFVSWSWKRGFLLCCVGEKVFVHILCESSKSRSFLLVCDWSKTRPASSDIRFEEWYLNCNFAQFVQLYCCQHTGGWVSVNLNKENRAKILWICQI